MAEQEPDATVAQEKDLSQLDMAELEKLVDEIDENPELQAAPDEPADEPEPQASTEPEPAADTVEPEPADEPEPVPSELDELRAQLDVVGKQAKHFESVAGGHAGKVGYLERQLQELRDQVSRQVAQPQADSYAEPQPQPPVQPAQVPDNYVQYMSRQAIDNGERAFLSNHGDIMVKDEASGQSSVDPLFQVELQKHTAEVQRLQSLSDPAQIQQEAERIMSDAYGQFDIARAAVHAAETTRKRADSAASLKAKKRTAESEMAVTSLSRCFCLMNITKP